MTLPGPAGSLPGMAARRKAAPEPPPTVEGEPSFEEGLERLEGIVDRLERGDLPLEEALAAFEEGVALTRRAAGQLEVAERRIEELVADGDSWLVRPLEADDGDDA